jgi:hypothetical protein
MSSSVDSSCILVTNKIQPSIDLFGPKSSLSTSIASYSASLSSRGSTFSIFCF